MVTGVDIQHLLGNHGSMTNQNVERLIENDRPVISAVESSVSNSLEAPTRFVVASESRVSWVDTARGIGIILVVYAHVLRGHLPLGGDASVAWATAQDTFIYSFHMPLFFVLGGLFLWQSIGKDRWRFVSERRWQIIYPYLLWSVIAAGLEVIMSRFVNTPLTWQDIAMIPVKPVEQYWFLYALLIHQLVIAAVWPRKWLLVPVALLGLALLQNLGGGWIQIRAFGFLPFVVAGILLASALNRVAASSFMMQLGLTVGGWLAFIVLWELLAQDKLMFGGATLLGFAGSIGTIGVAMLLASTRAARLLNILGEASLAIYLAHTMFSAGTRIMLKLAGIAPDNSVSLLAASIAGLLGPWLLWEFAKMTGYSRLMGFGGSAKPAMA
jgi:fucose 4-O-acetylase-like acetyltransferase